MPVKNKICSLLLICAISGCISKTETPKIMPKDKMKGMIVDTACLMLQSSKKGSKPDMVQLSKDSQEISRKYGVDPSDPKQKELMQRSIEFYKNDKDFSQEVQKEVMSKCMKK
jgi:hypothetical protein